jgi:tetratricopeptide (TPR) repeat protein
MGSSNYKRYAAMSKENYQFYFKKLLEVNEEYSAKILEKCFSVTSKYADLKAVILETPNGHAYLARFLHGKGMWEEAKNEYMMAINLEPINPIHYAELANAFSSRKDFVNAITWWQKQKMLSPQDESIYLSLSYGFMRLNRFDDALRELRDLMKLSPENINYQVKLMRTLLAVGRVDEAIHEYHKAIENNQNFSKSIYDKIRHYQKGGDYPEAIRTLNEALTSVLDGR